MVTHLNNYLISYYNLAFSLNEHKEHQNNSTGAPQQEKLWLEAPGPLSGPSCWPPPPVFPQGARGPAGSLSVHAVVLLCHTASRTKSLHRCQTWCNVLLLLWRNVSASRASVVATWGPAPSGWEVGGATPSVRSRLACVLAAGAVASSPSCASGFCLL